MSTNAESGLLGKIDRETTESVFGDIQPVEAHFRRISARNAEKTVQNRRVAFRQFVEHCSECYLNTDEITPEHIELWIDRMLNDDYAPRSIRSKVYAVSAVIGTLVNHGVIDENPVENVELKQYSGTRISKHTETRYLEIEEYEALRDTADKLRNQIVVELLWETGIRATEAVSIEISDIDRDARSIDIESAKKGELSEPQIRTVYYSRGFERSLRDWINRGGRRSYLGADGESGHLLVTKEASQMATNRVGEIVADLAEEADIQEVLYTDQSGTERRRVTPHALRHSFAVHRVKNGMPIVYLQELLGHEDIDVTRQYLQFRDDDVADAERRYRPSV